MNAIGRFGTALLLTVLLANGAPARQGGATASVRPRNADELARVREAVRTAANSRAAADAIPFDLRGTAGLGDDARAMRGGDEKARAEALKTLGALGLAAETQADASAAEKVRAIKSGVEYRTAKAGTASNWYQRLLDGLSRWMNDSFRNLFRGSGNVGNLDAPNLSLPGWLIYVVWILLAAIVVAAAWPLVRLIRFRIERRKRKAKGILEEEPERTRSEYLSLADALAAQGDFRGAIRMSYLAALKRFDEARVARFDRGETNWEHLGRIRASAALPPGLDFRPATAAFDHYWYGKRPAHAEDYARFVAWYDEVDAALRRAVAA